MRLSGISLLLGLGALAAATSDGSDDACLAEWQVCPPLKPLVNVLLGLPDVKQICQQIDPEAQGPNTVTVTDSQPAATVTRTSYTTVTSPVSHTSSAVVIATYSSQAVVTNRFSSAAVQLVQETATAIDTETVTITETNTIPETQQATVTKTSTLTTEDITIVSVTTTTTVTSVADAAPTLKRRTVGLPGVLQPYSTEELSDACWCVEFDTVTVTATLAPTTQTQTIVVASTVPSSVAVIRTIEETETIVGTATTDLTTVFTQLSTATTTITSTEQATVSATADQTVDVTALETVTVTATSVDEHITVTVPVTVTTTTTPAPTNVFVNPGFTGADISPWTTSIYYFQQGLDSTCAGLISSSSKCIYFLLADNGETGIFDLTQVVKTYVGQYYAVKFQYYILHDYDEEDPIPVISCTAGSTAFVVPAGITGGASFQTVTGGFTATASTTTFECTSQVEALNDFYIYFYGFEMYASAPGTLGK